MTQRIQMSLRVKPENYILKQRPYSKWISDPPIQRSKDRISQLESLGLQARLWLRWPSDLDCVSHQTSGYRTRKLRLWLGGLRQGALHSNGFARIQTDAAAWFRERDGDEAVVHGTVQ